MTTINDLTLFRLKELDRFLASEDANKRNSPARTALWGDVSTRIAKYNRGPLYAKKLIDSFGHVGGTLALDYLTEISLLIADYYGLPADFEVEPLSPMAMFTINEKVFVITATKHDVLKLVVRNFTGTLEHCAEYHASHDSAAYMMLTIKQYATPVPEIDSNLVDELTKQYAEA